MMLLNISARQLPSILTDGCSSTVKVKSVGGQMFIISYCGGWEWYIACFPAITDDTTPYFYQEKTHGYANGAPETSTTHRGRSVTAGLG
jgi:hypothetical protein